MAVAAQAQAMAAAIQAARPPAPAIGRPVPALASVLVPFDPLAIDLDEAIRLVRSAIATADGLRTVARDGPDAAPPIEIPVRYGGSDGPGPRRRGRPPRPPTRGRDRAPCVGHLPRPVPGVRPGLRLSRWAAGGHRDPAPGQPARASPGGERRDQPGEQTAVYPLAMPGGWQLIGRTTTRLFDPSRAEPALFRPGATVRFVPVSDR